MPPFDDSRNVVDAPVSCRPIVKTPGTCGGSARIDGTRISVWTLENARRIGLSDRDLLESYPHISAAEVAAAAAYAALHREEIDMEIRRNEEA